MNLRRPIAALCVILLWVAMSSGFSPATADDIRDAQWQLNFLHAEEAWEQATGTDQVVAVIDSGVDGSHPDLRGQVLPGADFVDGTTDGRTDVVGHGTTVATLIAGKADDTTGVVGLAPDTKILPIRVLDPNNQYKSADNVAQAIRWATDHGATIINMSLGSSDSSEILSAAVRYAFEHDVLVVACNGNTSNERGSEIWHPAREPGVIAVSGVTHNGEMWDGALAGSATVLAAPAVDITMAQPGGGHATGQGTSFATPMVAASAALVRSRFPTMNIANVINRLITTAWDFGPQGFDPEYGYGIVNPSLALSASIAKVHYNPLLPRGYHSGSGNIAGEPSHPGLSETGGSEQKRIGITTTSFIAASAVVAFSAFIMLIGFAVSMRRRKTFSHTTAYSRDDEHLAPEKQLEQLPQK